MTTTEQPENPTVEEPAADAATEPAGDAAPKEPREPKPPRLVKAKTMLIAAGVALLVGAGSVGAVAITQATGFQAELAVAAEQAADDKTEISALSRDNRNLEKDADAVAQKEEDLAALEETLIDRAAELTREEAVVAANTIAGDGIYIVGTDVSPGIYKSDGGESCYWARKSLSGDDIIDNHLGAGPSVLTIQATDGLVQISGCAPFTKTG